ncbi:MAG: DUF2854 domain-containing protein [Jaaginema sp. PMC 1079.18]|nr:DUF2854 domain-containing protein [Jaaginema sp. PMC 1080.18]MEC4853528.1 DUF2854 domain-containing protein [Jaaginema sp. PMC 1079.18]MEC4868079.1 DUF2854 domain-containing protein [Jaaginema sp. PMC 1078.18]
MLRKIRLAKLALILGGILTITGFTAYALDYATLNLVGFFYGIPLLLGGLALKASELLPIPFSQPTPPEVLALRETQATVAQNKIRNDVTRYRYGQEAHLDESLDKLGLSPSDEERPILEYIRETDTDGAYTLVLEFESEYVPLETWKDKREKMEKYFGPDVRIEYTQPEADRIEVALIKSTNSPES